jgi:hypothetical protein
MNGYIHRIFSIMDMDCVFYEAETDYVIYTLMQTNVNPERLLCTVVILYQKLVTFYSSFTVSVFMTSVL